MITVTNVSLNFSGQNLFSDVNLKFTPGNCYGVIGANGAGKSTFLKILSGELDSTTGEVSIDPNCRMSVLKQDHFAYDEYTVLDTIIMGNKRLYDIMKEKDALYEKEDFSDEDGIKAAELEAEFAEMDGWEADSNASKLMQGLGLDESIMYSQMADLGGNEKVKVLLAQALFGDPDIILLDEPTNHLDLQAIEWLEDFLLDYEGTVIVVSHDRYFLNVVCTHIVDIDYSKVKMYVGNYEFWYESSQMMERLIKQQNKKAEEKIKELQTFIQRFSANKSKSKQATSRKKMLDKLTVEELPASSRRYPFVGFDMDREAGRDLLTVDGLSKTVNGEKLLNNISFTLNHDDKIAIMTRDYLVNGDYSVQFYEAESQEKLEQDIMNKYTECGYVVGTRLKDKLDSGSYRDIIELIICRSDFVSSMTDEIFFSAMFKAYSPEVAVNYVNSVDIFKKHSEKAEEEIRKGYEEYISGDDTFRIDFKVLDGVQDNVTQLEDKTGEFPLRALLIILVYIGGLFGIVEYYLDKNSGTFITLPRMYRVAGKPLYAFISCVLFAVSAMLTLAVAGQLKGAADILHMVVYVIAVTLFAWLVAIPVRRANAMISIIPVLLIACLILCPVFINITAYVPFAKYIRALLLPWYMLK